jgi:hypothetical protein
MTMKIKLSAQDEHDIGLIQQETGMSRQSAIRKLKRRARLAAKETEAETRAKARAEAKAGNRRPVRLPQ